MRWDEDSLQRPLVEAVAEQNTILGCAVMALLASEEDDARFGPTFARWRAETVADLRRDRERIVSGLQKNHSQPVWGAGFMRSVAEDHTNFPYVSKLAPLLHQALQEVWDQPTLVDANQLGDSIDAYVRRRIVELLRDEYAGEAYGECDVNGDNAFVRVYLRSIDPLLTYAAAQIAFFGVKLLGRIYAIDKK